MTLKSGKTVLSLSQFMLRGEVLRLYRAMMRTANRIEDKQHRKYLKDSIKSGFKENNHYTEEEVIKMMITKGKMSLKELEQTIPASNKT